jgi:hypothetical protein
MYQFTDGVHKETFLTDKLPAHRPSHCSASAQDDGKDCVEAWQGYALDSDTLPGRTWADASCDITQHYVCATPCDGRPPPPPSSRSPPPPPPPPLPTTDPHTGVNMECEQSNAAGMQVLDGAVTTSVRHEREREGERGRERERESTMQCHAIPSSPQPDCSHNAVRRNVLRLGLVVFAMAWQVDTVASGLQQGIPGQTTYRIKLHLGSAATNV